MDIEEIKKKKAQLQYNILKVANTTANKTANKIEVAGSFSDVSY